MSGCTYLAVLIEKRHVSYTEFTYTSRDSNECHTLKMPQFLRTGYWAWCELTSALYREADIGITARTLNQLLASSSPTCKNARRRQWVGNGDWLLGIRTRWASERYPTKLISRSNRHECDPTSTPWFIQHSKGPRGPFEALGSPLEAPSTASGCF